MVTALIIIGLVALSVLVEVCPRCHDHFTRTNLEAIEQYLEWTRTGLIHETYAKAYIEWHLSHILQAQPSRFGTVSYAGFSVSRHDGKLLALSPVRA